MNQVRKTEDPLGRFLAIPTLCELIAALLWAAKDERGRVVMHNDGALYSFLRGLKEKHREVPLPVSISRILDRVYFHEGCGGAGSRQVEQAMSFLRASNYYDHPTDVRRWMIVKMGRASLRLFSEADQKVILALGEEFRHAHPVVA